MTSQVVFSDLGFIRLKTRAQPLLIIHIPLLHPVSAKNDLVRNTQYNSQNDYNTQYTFESMNYDRHPTGLK